VTSQYRVRVGDRFGRRVVTNTESKHRRNSARRCKVVCDCGYQSDVLVRSLVLGLANCCFSCRVFTNTTPGVYREHLYENGVWRRLCHAARGGEKLGFPGIELGIDCRWEGPGGFEAFLAAVGPRPPTFTLQRMDETKPWVASNCHWAPRKVKAQPARMLTVNGVTQTLGKWAASQRISASTIRDRLLLGWTPEDAIKPRGYRAFVPTKPEYTPDSEIDGETIRAWSQKSGLTVSTILRRLNLQWEPMRAVTTPLLAKPNPFPRSHPMRK